MTRAWTPDELPDLSGQTYVVTGANGGLGLEITRALAVRGARVWMACRRTERGDEAREKVQATQPNAALEVASLDLADLESVRRFSEQLLEHDQPIDGLVNNAGVMAIPRAATVQGHEMQFGTNHLGHFALTGRLLPLLLRAERGRVVTVSSNLHQLGRIDFDDLDGSVDYGKWRAYGQSKLANLLFTYALERRFRAGDTRAIAVAAHPGYADTPLQTTGAALAKSRLKSNVFGWFGRRFGQSAANGALPVIFAAAEPSVSGGEYFGPSWLELWGPPRRVASNARSHNQDVGERLWEISERLTQVVFDIRPTSA